MNGLFVLLGASWNLGSWKQFALAAAQERRVFLTMRFLSAQCRVCKGDQFRAEPPETWVERVILPRLFLCPGRCITCFKRRYLPTFQRWTALPNTWR